MVSHYPIIPLSQPTISIFTRKKIPRKQPQDLETTAATHQNTQHIVSMGSLENSSGSQVVTIDVIEAKNLLSAGYHYIDVRTVEEYNKGHVDAEKILNIPYMFNTRQGRMKNPEFLKEISSFFKEDDRLVVGCQSGVRSLYATADLLKIGFKNVNDMGGGYLAWVENGFPLKMENVQEPKEEL